MNKDFYRFIKSHKLPNRIYDMLLYFGTIKNEKNEYNIKKFFFQRLQDVEYVESLAKYFEEKLRKYKKIPDIRCNLLDLINDLNYLKQYLI